MNISHLLLQIFKVTKTLVMSLWPVKMVRLTNIEKIFALSWTSSYLANEKCVNILVDS